jgi:hypothetical protein
MLLPPFPGFPALLQPWPKPVQRRINLLDLPIEIRLQILQSVLLTENERTLCECLLQPAENRQMVCCCFEIGSLRNGSRATFGRDWSAIIDRLIDLKPAFPGVCRQIQEESAQAFNLRNYRQLIVCDPKCLHNLLEDCTTAELSNITDIRHDIDMRRFTSLGGDHARLISELHFADRAIKLVLCFWFDTVNIGPLSKIKPGDEPIARRTFFVGRPREQSRRSAKGISFRLRQMRTNCAERPPISFDLAQYRDVIESWDDGF